MSHFDLPITKGNLETLDTLQNRSLYSKYKLIEVLPWAHTHTHIYDMRVQPLDKGHVGKCEHIGNLMGTQLGV